jgi:hypothetical protein
MPTNKQKREVGTLLRACGRGSEDSCNIAKKLSVLYAGSVITFSEAKIDPGHPNKLPFTGCLLLLDQASQKAPHGSQGHRIYVSKSVAQRKLSGIIGMAINYQPGDLDAHATRHKVGVVTKAWIEGNKVMVSGFIWDRDFPEADKELKGRNDLGMSMELADVYVDDENAQVWNLTDFEFTGATILKKDAAAYTHTSLAAQALKASKIKNDKYKKVSLAAKAATREEGITQMSDKRKDRKKVAATRRDTGETSLMIQAMGGQLANALQTTLGPLVNEIKASNARVQEGIEEMNGRLRLADVQASAEQDDDDVVLHAGAEDEDESDDMAAAHEDESDDMAAAHEDESDDMAAAQASDDDSSDDSSSSSDYQAMEDLSLEDASQEPGEVNRDASNRGSKTTVTKPPKQGEHFKGNIAKGRIHGKGKSMRKPFGMDAAAVRLEGMYASAVRENRKLRGVNASLVQEANSRVHRLSTKVETLQAQVERFADHEARRSVMPTELINLASKAGISLSDVKASGQKLDVSTIDSMFAAARNQGIVISPEQRMAMKMQLEEQGIMDTGVVDRGIGRIN